MASAALINQFISKFDTNGNGVLTEIPREELEQILEAVMKKTTKKVKRERKAAKDPNAPKKATTPYFAFLGEKREEIKASLSDEEKSVEKITTLVAKKAGEMWRELSEDEKAPYIETASKDKERYAKEIENYVPTLETGETYDVDEYPEAPEEWEGPFKMTYLCGYPKDLKKKGSTFIKFEDAVEKANELGDECSGITKTSTGYTLRSGASPKETPDTKKSQGLASWSKKGIEISEKPKKEKKSVKKLSKKAKNNKSAEKDESPEDAKDEGSADAKDESPEDANDESPEDATDEGSVDAKDEDTDDEEQQDVDVEEVEHGGKTYFHNEETGQIFDPETGEEVGKMVDGEIELD